MKERLAELGFAAGWRLIRALPRPVAAAAFTFGADRMVRRQSPGVRRLERNLERVLGGPVPPAMLRQAVRSYARYWLEAFRLPSQTQQQNIDGFILENGHRLQEDRANGTGVVIALSHSGNWDAAGAWVVANGMPLTTVAERLKPEALYQRFVAYRESLGMNIVPATGGESAPTEVLERALADRHVVPLLADRDLSRRGIEVRFFGGRTRMPAGPALLSIRSGAPLYVVNLWFEDAGPRGRLVGPLTAPKEGTLTERVAALTQLVAETFEKGIAEHPADWHMLQKLWLD